MYQMLKCKKCGSDQYIKSGHVRGYQRYKCKECQYQFTETKARGVSPVLKQLAIVLYSHCGVSMLGIAKLLKVSAVAVLKWIKKSADSIPELETNHRAEIVQIDEVWHFVNGKKTLYGSGEPLMGYRVELSPGNWGIVAIKI